ncbi:NAD(P)/FAD-dependent oxidoreductase [Gordonia sp. X0973]|uniref:phytoene desaturase family protein n=1 Tax=Gordonia sp. X0973 TaxID=2742602 RepID=UPI000F524A11|nr:NAD(P)/FAD-dependent oxidoreductase [Gordonia sp. X0973]QKT08590.1 NAD(P)/FAD-dependent oxidoreductase [Gordonia sp. X0973]
MTTAVVVGGGPNGLAAALHLARHGVSVTILEAESTVGGGARSGEAGYPGLINDYCSAVHPLGVGSPFWKTVDLERYGLGWCWPEVDCAHPLDDGRAGVLYQSVDETAAGMGVDGKRWKRLVGDLAEHFDDLAADLLGPVIGIPSHPFRLASFGPRALLSAQLVSKYLKTDTTRAVFGGAAAHAFTRLDRPLTASLGLMMLAGGHRYGWVVARGGSGSITRALVDALGDYDVTIATDTFVRSRADIPDADTVMLDITPAQVLRLYDDDLPGRVARAYRRFRVGSAAFKVDFAIEGDIPWTNPDCRRAGTVHLGGTFEEIAATERARIEGTMSERPFVLVGQQYLADPSRSSGNINPIWSYAHVPPGYDGDATELVVNQIERFAPGFRDTIVHTQSRGTAALQAYNPNYAAGDIIGGANDGLQMVLRPRFGIDPYATGIDGVYLCSQSTPPGAGIHGMCGFNAAQRALHHLRIPTQLD